jgi:hypothetical protein
MKLPFNENAWFAFQNCALGPVAKYEPRRKVLPRSVSASRRLASPCSVHAIIDHKGFETSSQVDSSGQALREFVGSVWLGQGRPHHNYTSKSDWIDLVGSLWFVWRIVVKFGCETGDDNASTCAFDCMAVNSCNYASVDDAVEQAVFKAVVLGV